MKFWLRALGLIVAGALAGCSGGGGGGNGSVPATSLLVTVVDIRGQPVQGVDVVLHGTDERSVEQDLQTGEDGVADFGDIGRAQVTLTIAQSQFSSTTLLTQVAVAAGRRVVNLGGPIELNVDDRVSATFSVSSSDPEAILQAVGPTDDDLSDGEANFDDGIVIVSDPPGLSTLGNDGSLSLLAATLDNNQTVNQYGFLLDQPFTDGAHYTGVINRVAAIQPWTADGNGAALVQLFAMRKGVQFFIGRDDQGGVTGGFQALREFPADFYFALSTQSATSPDQPSVFWARSYNALPGQVDIDFAGFSRSDLLYDAPASQYTWQRTGSGANLQILERFEQAEDASRGSSWTILLPPTRSQFVLPDLPPELEARISRSGDNDFAALQAFDFRRVTDYAALDRTLPDLSLDDRRRFDVDVVFITEPGSEVTPPDDEAPPGEDDPMIPGVPGLPGLP